MASHMRAHGSLGSARLAVAHAALARFSAPVYGQRSGKGERKSSH
jgi:hypothetical protein